MPDGLNSAAIAAAGAGVVFVWLGMVAGISFLEAPLKFQAPGITIRLGLGIGRLVFRALNAVEMVLAVLLIGALACARPCPVALGTGAVAVTMLAIQVVAVRPRLRKRSDAVLAADEDPAGGMRDRSRAHYVYAGLELVKAAALLATGVGLQLAALAG